MNISTLDPISLKRVSDVQHAPFVIEGKGLSALKIYFESEYNKYAYLQLPVQELTPTGIAVNE